MSGAIHGGASHSVIVERVAVWLSEREPKHWPRPRELAALFALQDHQVEAAVREAQWIQGAAN